MPVKYDSSVKRPLEKMEYTQKQVMELKECSESIFSFLKYVKIIHPDKGEVNFSEYIYPHQKDMLKKFVNDRFHVCLLPRQISGKTTIVSIFALYYTMFNSNKTIGIVANKERTATMILSRFKRMYESLPLWLKPGVLKYAETSVVFDNGTRIIVSATSPDALRGEQINLLILDEFAFVPKNIADAFWSSNLPTIFASEESKIIVVSCVIGDTMVFTDKGPKMIESFVDNKKNINISEYSVVGRRNDFNSGNIFINSGISETKIIESTSSLLECSPNHKLWACKNGNFGWFKASELTTNDYISIKYGMEKWGNNDYINFESISKVYYKNGRRINRKLQKGKTLKIKKITPDVAYLFGLYISEGCADEHRVVISCGDDISEVFDKLNLKYRCCDNMHYVIGSVSLVRLLKCVGFDINRKAPEKEIPDRLLEMSRENIISMIQGIFDGDGWSRKDKGTIGIGLSSRKLIFQIRALLLNFGILTDYYVWDSKNNKKKGKVKTDSIQYRLQCSHTKSKIFYEKIGFRLNRKQEKRKYLNIKSEIDKKDSIPYMNQIILPYKKYIKEKFTSLDRGKNVLNLSRYLTLNIGAYLKENNCKIWNDLKDFYSDNVSENIKWEKIKNIKNSENTVYDFSLPDVKDDKWCHSILYNGMIGHQTPNGMFGLFHELYSKAERGENSFIPTKVNYYDIPGKDEEWAKQAKKDLGEQRYRQEILCTFLGSTNTVIDANVLDVIVGGWKDPLLKEIEDKLFIYEKPEDGYIYIIGADSGKGTGNHYSSIQVLKVVDNKIPKLQQVAVFNDNNTDIYTFSHIVNRLSLYYNRSYIMVENNAEGSTVVNNLWWEFENERLVNTGSKKIDLGVRAKRNTKPRAVLLMKKLIEDSSLEIVDRETLDQLTTFIENNGKFYGKDNYDDLISALYWACYIFEMDVFDEKVDFFNNDDKNEEDEMWGVLSDLEDKIVDWDFSWMDS